MAFNGVSVEPELVVANDGLEKIFRQVVETDALEPDAQFNPLPQQEEPLQCCDCGLPLVCGASAFAEIGVSELAGGLPVGGGGDAFEV